MVNTQPELLYFLSNPNLSREGSLTTEKYPPRVLKQALAGPYPSTHTWHPSTLLLARVCGVLGLVGRSVGQSLTEPRAGVRELNGEGFGGAGEALETGAKYREGKGSVEDGGDEAFGLHGKRNCH